MKTKLVKSFEHIRVTLISKPLVGHPGKWELITSFKYKGMADGVKVIYDKEDQEGVIRLMFQNAEERIKWLKSKDRSVYTERT